MSLRREVEDELAQILVEHKVTALCRRRGLTQAELAKRLGREPATDRANRIGQAQQSNVENLGENRARWMQI